MRRALYAVLAAAQALALAQSLRLHPQNPHYFLSGGKPAILITSGEHYGAVLNLDFDYARYLETLKADGLNLTRIFAGAYREVPGSFRIERNTLAPAPGRFICPWARSGQPGAADGGNRFDLTRWDLAYFARLKDFMRRAAQCGVIVELNLFCPYYEDQLWELSPLNAKNNVNGIGDVSRTEALTLKDGRLVAAEDAMLRKIVSALRQFDNLYYEICNEPYFGGVTPEWQKHIAQVIRKAGWGLHLISQNISNGSRKVEDPNPAVSLFNFHYSRPPESVALNYGLNKAIGNNETGFDGTSDAVYRIQGWDFLVAGGALYNNLDYSFTVGHEDGTFVPPPTQPGGGGPALRRQLRILRDFLYGFDFLRMAPAVEVVKAGLPEGASARVLAEPGKQYAVYVHHGRQVEGAQPRYQVDVAPHELRLALELPAGSYEAAWVNTRTGQADKRESFSHSGGEKALTSPVYTEDIALRVKAVSP